MTTIIPVGASSALAITSNINTTAMITPAASITRTSIVTTPAAMTAASPLTMKRRPAFRYLPVEVIQEFLFYLSPHDYDSARLVCRQWFEASLSRIFLEAHIHKLNAGNSKGTNFGCPQSCSCSKRLELHALRKMFGSMIVEWPGSRFRLNHFKSVLDGSGILDVAPGEMCSSGNSNSSPSTAMTLLQNGAGFESVGFSRPSGSFAGLVVNRKAKRQLYVYRIFSRNHNTPSARKHRQSCCPCNPEPGPLYMILDIKAALDTPVVRVAIEEIEKPNAVRRISITYLSGMNETYTFDGLAAHRFYQVNVKDNVASFASAAHREQKPIGSYSPSMPSRRFNKLFGLFYKFQKQTLPQENKASLEIKKAPIDVSLSRMRVGFFETKPSSICHVLYVPLQEDGTATLIMTPTNEIYVGGQATQLSPRRGSIQKVRIHHRLSCPSEQQGARLLYISVSPTIYYDFVDKTNYIGIAAGYSNGEVWFWQLNRGARQTNASNSRSSSSHETQNETDAARTTDGREAVTKENNAIYWPPHSLCVTAAMPVPNVVLNISEESLPSLQLVKDDLPSHEDDLPDAKVWRLAYLPGLKALSFVGRGMVILAADTKAIYVFDLREPHGFERVKLNAGYSWG